MTTTHEEPTLRNTHGRTAAPHSPGINRTGAAPMAEFTPHAAPPRTSHGRPVRNTARHKGIHAGRIDRTPIHRPLRIPGRR
ncbi:hypothetical protein GCM10027089_58720 [Nocardia thraciensis]